jgi:hypothetical protein
MPRVAQNGEMDEAAEVAPALVEISPWEKR